MSHARTKKYTLWHGTTGSELNFHARPFIFHSWHGVFKVEKYPMPGPKNTPSGMELLAQSLFSMPDPSFFTPGMEFLKLKNIPCQDQKIHPLAWNYWLRA